jgi:hypothetical protein
MRILSNVVPLLLVDSFDELRLVKDVTLRGFGLTPHEALLVNTYNIVPLAAMMTSDF